MNSDDIAKLIANMDQMSGLMSELIKFHVMIISIFYNELPATMSEECKTHLTRDYMKTHPLINHNIGGEDATN